jgi:monooxygenase
MVAYHGEFQVSREEYDRHVRPLIGNANILAGVGDGFNTPITVCNITKIQVHLDWSYSRPARGENDPFSMPRRRKTRHEICRWRCWKSWRRCSSRNRGHST